MKNFISTYLTDTYAIISAQKHAILNGILIGSFVGLAIAFYDWMITSVMSQHFRELPASILGFMPFVGMLLTGLVIKFFKIHRTSTADEVVFAYHTDVANLDLNTSVPKFVASLATIGFGGSAGLEGSSKWVGAIVGLFVQKIVNLVKPLKKIKGDLTIAVMTGASAGIAAIFKAPLSGTIMALESPYKKDLAHEPLVQSFIGAVTSYAIFTSLRGSSKFFLIDLQYTLRWEDIFICALIGLFTGLFSTMFLKTLGLIREKFSMKLKIMPRYFLGGVLLTAIAFIGFYEIGHFVTLFGGNDIINNIFNNQYNTSQAFLIAILKSIATIITFAFGGVGGFFLPSATIGACLGELFQNIFHLATPGVLPFIGIASFIAASYNGLLFGPVLIAEISGESSLVVLGIVASTIAYLVSNGVSNSSHQKDHR